MKKLGMILIVWVITMLIGSCTDVNTNSLLDFDASSYVELCDYSNVLLSEAELSVSKPDIETFILMDLSYYGVRKDVNDRDYLIDEDIALIELESDITEIEYVVGSQQISLQFDEALVGMKKGEMKDIVVLSDDGSTAVYKVKLKGIRQFATLDDEKMILDFYSANTMDDVYSFVKCEIKKNIIFENVYEYICSKSYIKQIPDVWERYINQTVNDAVKFAKDNRVSFEECTGMNKQEFTEVLTNEVNEIIVLKAVCDKEQISVGINEYEKAVADIEELSGLERGEAENTLRKSIIINDMLKGFVKMKFYEKRQ